MTKECRALSRLISVVIVIFYFGISPASAEDTAAVEGGYYGTEIKKALDYLKTFGGDPKDPNSPISIHKKLTKRFKSLKIIVKDIPEAGVHGMNYWSSINELILDTSLFVGNPHTPLKIDPSKPSNLFLLINIISTLYHEYLHSVNDGLWSRICDNTSEAFTGKNHLEWRAHVTTNDLLITLVTIKMKEIDSWPNATKIDELKKRVFVLEEFIKLSSAVRTGYTSLNESGYGPKIGTEISETLEEGAKDARKTADYYNRLLKLRAKLKAGLKKAKEDEKRATGTPKTEDSSNSPGAADEDASFEIPPEFAGSPVPSLLFQNAIAAVNATALSYTGSPDCPQSALASAPSGPALATSAGHADTPDHNATVTPVDQAGGIGPVEALFESPANQPVTGFNPAPSSYLSFEIGGCGARPGAEVTSFQTIGGNTRTVATRGQGDGTAVCGGFKFTRSAGPEGQRTSIALEAQGILNSGTQSTAFQRDLFTTPPTDSMVTLRQGNTLRTGLAVNQELGGFQGPNGQMWTWGVSAGGGVEVREYQLDSSFDQNCCGGGTTMMSNNGTMVTPYVRGGVFVSTYLPGGTMFDVGLAGSYSPARQVSVEGRDGFDNPVGDTVNLPGGTTVMLSGTFSVDLESIFGQADARVSDARLKRNITRLTALAHGINLYAYRYVGDETRRIGVLAQEVISVKPDAVSRRKNGYYAVDYTTLFADPKMRSALAESEFELRL